MSHEERIDELYSTPLSQFTERRNALAKELKGAGEKEAAANVKKLAKPTLAAWVVNQVARREPELMRELIAVQDGLASASSAKDLRDLTHERRDLVTKLKRAANAILEQDGHAAGSTTLQQVSQTLLAGATEEEQELLLRGRLTRDLSSSGLEQVWGFDPAEDGDEDERDEEGDRRARQEAEDLTKQAAQAQQRATDLAAEVDRVRRALQEMEDKAKAARSEAEELEDRAAAARRAAGLED